jgi:hypothetical protein
MKKLLLLLLIAGSAHAGMNLPSNSVSLLGGVDTAQTIIFVPTLTPVPSGAYGASIISGNVPYNSGLDQYIEPIWVISGNNNAITIQRGTRATANPQGTWTVYSQQQGLITGHTIRTLPRLLYYAGTATPTFTVTATPTSTPTPTGTWSTPTWTPTQAMTPVATPAAYEWGWLNGQLTMLIPNSGRIQTNDIESFGNEASLVEYSPYNGDVYACNGALSTNIVHYSPATIRGGNGDYVVVGSGGVSLISTYSTIYLSGKSTDCSNKPVTNVPTPSTDDGAANRLYVTTSITSSTTAQTGSAQPTPAPRRVGDIYVNSAGTTVYVGVSLTPVTGWLQVKP